VTDGVLRELRSLLGGEADTIAPDLPPGIRHLWLDVAPAT
jgi:hypothetical protein